jgi:hypothetical protein
MKALLLVEWLRSLQTLTQNPLQEDLPMATLRYVGLDLHKKEIVYCAKTKGGKIRDEGSIPSTRQGLDAWLQTLGKPWVGAMEATLFTGWVTAVPLRSSGAGITYIESTM